jgi:hypothetical protein
MIFPDDDYDKEVLTNTPPPQNNRMFRSQLSPNEKAKSIFERMDERRRLIEGDLNTPYPITNAVTQTYDGDNLRNRLQDLKRTVTNHVVGTVVFEKIFRHSSPQTRLRNLKREVEQLVRGNATASRLAAEAMTEPSLARQAEGLKRALREFGAENEQAVEISRKIDAIPKPGYGHLDREGLVALIGEREWWGLKRILARFLYRIVEWLLNNPIEKLINYVQDSVSRIGAHRGLSGVAEDVFKEVATYTGQFVAAAREYAREQPTTTFFEFWAARRDRDHVANQRTLEDLTRSIADKLVRVALNDSAWTTKLVRRVVQPDRWLLNTLQGTLVPDAQNEDYGMKVRRMLIGPLLTFYRRAATEGEISPLQKGQASGQRLELVSLLGQMIPNLVNAMLIEHQTDLNPNLPQHPPSTNPSEGSPKPQKKGWLSLIWASQSKAGFKEDDFEFVLKLVNDETSKQETRQLWADRIFEGLGDVQVHHFAFLAVDALNNLLTPPRTGEIQVERTGPELVRDFDRVISIIRLYYGNHLLRQFAISESEQRGYQRAYEHHNEFFQETEQLGLQIRRCIEAYTRPYRIVMGDQRAVNIWEKVQRIPDEWIRLDQEKRRRFVNAVRKESEAHAASLSESRKNGLQRLLGKAKSLFSGTPTRKELSTQVHEDIPKVIRNWLRSRPHMLTELKGRWSPEQNSDLEKVLDTLVADPYNLQKLEDVKQAHADQLKSAQKEMVKEFHRLHQLINRLRDLVKHWNENSLAPMDKQEYRTWRKERGDGVVTRFATKVAEAGNARDELTPLLADLEGSAQKAEKQSHWFALLNQGGEKALTEMEKRIQELQKEVKEELSTKGKLSKSETYERIFRIQFFRRCIFALRARQLLRLAHTRNALQKQLHDTYSKTQVEIDTAQKEEERCRQAYQNSEKGLNNIKNKEVVKLLRETVEKNRVAHLSASKRRQVLEKRREDQVVKLVDQLKKKEEAIDKAMLDMPSDTPPLTEVIKAYDSPVRLLPPTSRSLPDVKKIHEKLVTKGEMSDELILKLDALHIEVLNWRGADTGTIGLLRECDQLLQLFKFDCDLQLLRTAVQEEAKGSRSYSRPEVSQAVAAVHVQVKKFLQNGVNPHSLLRCEPVALVDVLARLTGSDEGMASLRRACTLWTEQQAMRTAHEELQQEVNERVNRPTPKTLSLEALAPLANIPTKRGARRNLVSALLEHQGRCVENARDRIYNQLDGIARQATKFPTYDVERLVAYADQVSRKQTQKAVLRLGMNSTYGEKAVKAAHHAFEKLGKGLEHFLLNKHHQEELMRMALVVLDKLMVVDQ